MKTIHTVFDKDVVKEIIIACRTRIDREPEDTVTRLRLASCLIAWAFYQCGQEVNATYNNTVDSFHLNKNLIEQNSHELIENGVRQAMIVSALTTKPEEKKDAEALINFVSLFGDENISQKCKDETNSIFEEIIWCLNQKFENRHPKA